MRQLAATMPTWLAMGLAVLAAIMSGPHPRLNDMDAAVLWLLTAQAAAIDMPQAVAGGPSQFAGP